MKFTEGAFRDWAYAAAERIYGDKVYTWAKWERTKKEKAKMRMVNIFKHGACTQSGRFLIVSVFFSTRIDD